MFSQHKPYAFVFVIEMEKIAKVAESLIPLGILITAELFRYRNKKIEVSHLKLKVETLYKSETVQSSNIIFDKAMWT